MIKKITALILIFILSFVSVPLKVIAEPGNSTTNDEFIISLMSEKEKAVYYLNKYGEEYNSNMGELLGVVLCESNNEMSKKGDMKNSVYLAKGIGQYHQETWERHSKMSGFNGDINSLKDQAKQLAWTFSDNGTESMRREWTTYRAIKNGGVYKFHSTLLNKEFTVRCGDKSQ